MKRKKRRAVKQASKQAGKQARPVSAPRMHHWNHHTTSLSVIFLLLAIAFIIAHNVCYWLLKIDMPMFFILSLILAALFAVSILHKLGNEIIKE